MFLLITPEIEGLSKLTINPNPSIYNSNTLIHSVLLNTNGGVI